MNNGTSIWNRHIIGKGVLDVFSFPDETNVIKQITLDNSGIINVMDINENEDDDVYEKKDNYALYDDDMYFL